MRLIDLFIPIFQDKPLQQKTTQDQDYLPNLLEQYGEHLSKITEEITLLGKLYYEYPKNRINDAFRIICIYLDEKYIYELVKDIPGIKLHYIYLMYSVIQNSNHNKKLTVLLSEINRISSEINLFGDFIKSSSKNIIKFVKDTDKISNFLGELKKGDSNIASPSDIFKNELESLLESLCDVVKKNMKNKISDVEKVFKLELSVIEKVFKLELLEILYYCILNGFEGPYKGNEEITNVTNEIKTCITKKKDIHFDKIIEKKCIKLFKNGYPIKYQITPIVEKKLLLRGLLKKNDLIDLKKNIDNRVIYDKSFLLSKIVKVLGQTNSCLSYLKHKFKAKRIVNKTLHPGILFVEKETFQTVKRKLGRRLIPEECETFLMNNPIKNYDELRLQVKFYHQKEQNETIESICSEIINNSEPKMITFSSREIGYRYLFPPLLYLLYLYIMIDILANSS